MSSLDKKLRKRTEGATKLIIYKMMDNNALNVFVLCFYSLYKDAVN